MLLNTQATKSIFSTRLICFISIKAIPVSEEAPSCRISSCRLQIRVLSFRHGPSVPLEFVQDPCPLIMSFLLSTHPSRAYYPEYLSLLFMMNRHRLFDLPGLVRLRQKRDWPVKNKPMNALLLYSSSPIVGLSLHKLRLSLNSLPSQSRTALGRPHLLLVQQTQWSDSGMETLTRGTPRELMLSPARRALREHLQLGNERRM